MLKSTKCLWVAGSMEVPSNTMTIGPLSYCTWFGKLKIFVSKVSMPLDVPADQTKTIK